VAVLLYDDAERVLPKRVNKPSFESLITTTSADEAVIMSGPKELSVSINSRIMSIVVTPPLVPPLKVCVQITLEHKLKNKGIDNSNRLRVE